MIRLQNGVSHFGTLIFSYAFTCSVDHGTGGTRVIYLAVCNMIFFLNCEILIWFETYTSRIHFGDGESYWFFRITSALCTHCKNVSLNRGKNWGKFATVESQHVLELNDRICSVNVCYWRSSNDGKIGTGSVSIYESGATIYRLRWTVPASGRARAHICQQYAANSRVMAAAICAARAYLALYICILYVGVERSGPSVRISRAATVFRAAASPRVKYSAPVAVATPNAMENLQRLLTRAPDMDDSSSWLRLILLAKFITLKSHCITVNIHYELQSNVAHL